MISLDDFARIFGEAYCKSAASNFSKEDYIYVRSTYTNWVVRKQPDFYKYPGAWIISYERVDDLHGNIANTNIKPSLEIRKLLSGDGFYGSIDLIIEYASKCALESLKGPIGYNNTHNPDHELINHAIQFFWDTIKNMKHSHNQWSYDPIVSFLETMYHVTDVMWVPNVCLMIDYDAKFKPDDSSSSIVYNILSTCGLFMLEYCKYKKTLQIDEEIPSEMNDDTIFAYIILYIQISVSQKIITAAELNDVTLLQFEIPNNIIKSIQERMNNSPEKKDELLSKYTRSDSDNVIIQATYKCLKQIIEQ